MQLPVSIQCTPVTLPFVQIELTMEERINANVSSLKIFYSKFYFHVNLHSVYPIPPVTLLSSDDLFKRRTEM